MRRMLPVGCLLLVLLLSVGALRSESPAASATPEVARIIASALGPSPLEENLRQLTDEIGGRVSGSPQMRQAAAWAVEAFRQAGVDAVHKEEFEMPASWREGETRLEVLSPGAFLVRVVSLGWSPPLNVEAAVVDLGEGSEADFARVGQQARGALLLTHSGLLRTWADLFDEYFNAPPIIERAVKVGAAGILWMSTREQGLLYRHQNSFQGKVDRLPQALVAREDAQRLARFLAAGKAVRVRLTMPNRVGGVMKEENVVAEIRGREKPEEIVILGAHLDSWELGTGALDNGCNAALVIEAARAFHAAGARPRRTMRFVLFSGEEQGLLGSWAYVRAHRDELDRTVAVVIYDAGMGRVPGYSLGGRRDAEAAVREALAPVESWGSNHHTVDASSGTDHVDFLLEGVPTLVANQEEANYILNYHATSDTFDKVDLRELKLHSALAAVTLWGLAERPERVAKRQSRAEIEVLLKETGLDQQMKAFGMWEAWERGERGRRP